MESESCSKISRYPGELCSTSVTSSDTPTSSDSSSSSSDIFYIYESGSTKDPVEVVAKPDESEECSRASAMPNCVRQHMKPMGFRERLTLIYSQYFYRWNLIRTLFVIFCLCWFLYNAVIVLRQYLQFDTIIYMEYQTPKTTGPPGITICVNLAINESMLEKLTVSDVLHANNTVEPNLNIEFSDVIHSCQLAITTVSTGIYNYGHKILYDCAEIVEPIVSMEEGNKCFTFFSDIYGNMSRAQNQPLLEFESFPQITIVFNDKHLDSVASRAMLATDPEPNNSATYGVYLVLHSPMALPLMQELTMHRIVRQKSSTIRFMKLIEKLKPSPYQTNCYEYDYGSTSMPVSRDSRILSSQNSLSDSGLSTYRSPGECILYCMWRVMFNTLCVHWYGIYTWEQVRIEESQYRLFRESRHYPFERNLNYCGQNINKTYQLYSDARKSCLQACNSACSIETFGIDNLYDFETLDGRTIVQIEWSTKPTVYISHQEKFTTPGFLGNIGGHAHIWLGISIVHIFRFFLRLIKPDLYFPQTSNLWIINWYNSLRARA